MANYSQRIGKDTTVLFRSTVTISDNYGAKESFKWPAAEASGSDKVIQVNKGSGIRESELSS